MTGAEKIHGNPSSGYARLVQPEEPVMTTIITAAGGNATAIDTLAAPLTRAAYAARGQALVAAYAAQGVEQAGFLIRTANAAHFEMAGGEFCGNAARAAALLLAPQGGAVSFSMSGFVGRVQAEAPLYRSEDRETTAGACLTGWLSRLCVPCDGASTLRPTDFAVGTFLQSPG